MEDQYPSTTMYCFINKAIPVRQGDIVYHEEYAFLPLELDQL